VYQSLYTLAIVFLLATAGWVWFRRKADSIVSDLEGQITLLKLRLQDMEEQLNSLQEELRQKHTLDR